MKINLDKMQSDFYQEPCRRFSILAQTEVKNLMNLINKVCQKGRSRVKRSERLYLQDAARTFTLNSFFATIILNI